jgi:hypothetical protein
MSRFAVVYEDPSYEEPVIDDWAELLDGYVTVVKAPHELTPEEIKVLANAKSWQLYS